MTQDMLDERYGTHRSPRARWGMGIAIGIGIAAVVFFGWLTVQNTLDDVAVETTSFRLEDGSATIGFQITVPLGRSVACALEAQDEEHGIVGWKIVEYEASDLHTRAFRETIPLVAEATTGLVNSCWVT